MNAAEIDRAEIRGALEASPLAFAEQIIGQANQSLSSSKQARFGRKGSVSLELAGARRGLWCDHETGKGGDLLALIMRERACSFPEALNLAVEMIGGAMPVPMSRQPTPRHEAGDDVRLKVELAREIWQGSQPAAGTLTEQYLAGRELPLPAHVIDIRFHPTCPYGQQRRPAMVAAMRDIHSDEIVGVHRTFLTEDGRKLAKDAKRMLGRASGSAIKLSPDDEVTQGLFVCEGIESGLALLKFEFAPVWALGSSGGLAAFPVVGGIECLSIAADADTVGTKAAQTCAERWQLAGREVILMISLNAGEDLANLAARMAAG